MDAESEYFAFVERSNAARASGGDEAMRALLDEPVHPAILAKPDLHSSVRVLRGNAFCLLDRPDIGYREFELGFHDAPHSTRAEYLINWSKPPPDIVFTMMPAVDKMRFIERTLEILSFADAYVAPDDADQQIIIAHLRCIRPGVPVPVRQGARDAFNGRVRASYGVRTGTGRETPGWAVFGVSPSAPALATASFDEAWDLFARSAEWFAPSFPRFRELITRMRAGDPWP